MPILDHFHPPLKGGRHWESFHAMWGTFLAVRLNEQLLPSQYVAEARLHIGSRVEVDVATLEADRQPDEYPTTSSNGAVATAVEAYAPPTATHNFPAVFPDEIETLIYNMDAGPTLVAAIELVSPANKDRPESRRAFAHKCSAYLQRGVGLMVVDIVTERTANLHNELIDAMMLSNDYYGPGEPIYTASYHPVRRDSKDGIDVWLSGLHVGGDLPTMPLFLRGGPVLGIPLDETYARARRGSRL